MSSSPSLRLFAVGLGLAFAASAQARPRRPIDEFRENVEAGGRYEPGNVTVKVDASLPREAVKRLAASQGCAWDHQFGRRPYHVFECDPERDMAELIVAFSDKPGVRWVEAGFYDEEEAIPNDLFELQWYHRNTGQTVDMVAGVPGADMGSVDAWEVSPGSPQRVIAIVDIGIYMQHEDLAPQAWTNSGEICGNNRDDDNNGYVDDCNGWDIGGQDPDASPLTLPATQSDGDPCLRWHATYIAGLAAAQGNNGRGLAGTAWDASLMNLKRHRDSSCQGTSTRSAEATFYAVDNGADALGYSFNSSTNSTVFRESLMAADAAGVIAVMSAGNGGSNTNDATRYPNDYPMTHKIITAASDNRDRLDPASNYGSTKVDIASPGTYVVSTAIDAPDAYGVGSGTSMAVGFGLAAVTLAKTAYPAATTDQVFQAILAGGQAVPALACNGSSMARCVRTGRRLDLLGMMQQLAPLAPANLTVQVSGVVEIGNNDGEIGPGERALPQFSVSNNGTGGGFGLKGSLRVVSGAGLSPQNPTFAMGSAPAGQSLVPSRYQPVALVDEGCNTDFDAQLELTVTDVLGHRASAPFTVPVRCAAAPPPADAGVPAADAGVPVDSGASGPDAGGSPPDAGWVRDSGVHPDAWVRDSGVHPDSGAEPDPSNPRFESSGCTSAGPGPSLWLLAGLLLLARRRRP